MDEHQLDWVDTRLSRVEEAVSLHDAAIRELVGLVPEIKRLIKWSYILMGIIATVAVLSNAQSVVSIITNGIK